eukprot:CAMPEP_0176493744 /NCGR_PEP_ID=MMETSP0200_2-20121128/9709_1 /TAXON_ID=947934 /ORGANISM="Chaetoceros sp., Strain GSL56" /LENGTH=793 /DNA_ID=CAMNT_0017891421 /DNA_START=192 /DNA_END=2573 /DNA_ORIENTATION=-
MKLDSHTLQHQQNSIPDLSTSHQQTQVVEEDPLAHPENIELVQQSDTTFVEDDDHHPNLSIWSHNPMPIRNLCGAFEDMNDRNEEQVLLSPDDQEDHKKCHRTSPNGVDQYQSSPNRRIGQVSSGFPFDLKIEMPYFELYAGLKLNLSQPVIDRCSFYSVIHGINKEVQDMVAHDINCHNDDPQDENSAIVQAFYGSTKSSKSTEQHVNLAVVDEEKWLLAAIASRNQDEWMIRDCPESFAEAIGESDILASSVDGKLTQHSDNPLSVVSASRTQLWKPSRSWWEAKSGKNPWIEPSLHNKRWRYLWPLIHYHKFLAKCIKKLKRNQVDVKTSPHRVSAFLREEVCAVSDHLASVSKFDSDDWMDALPKFHGWIDNSSDNEKVLKRIICILPMKKLCESKEELDSPVFRHLIESSFEKAMIIHKEQLSSGAEYLCSDMNGSYKHSALQMPKTKKLNSSQSNMRDNRPPRHSGKGNSRPPRANKKHVGGRQNHFSNGGFPHGMMMQQHMDMSMNSCYPYGAYHQMNQSVHYMPPQHENDLYYGQNGWAPQMIPGNYNFLDQSMMSADMSVYYPPTDPMPNWNSHNAHDASLCSYNVEDMSQCSDQASQICAPEGVSLSFIGPTSSKAQGEICKTPSKTKGQGISTAPPSPAWAHLANAAMSSLASPSGQIPNSPQHMVVDRSGNIRANNVFYENGPVKPFLNYYATAQPGITVPPSPATQFHISQANSQHNPYFTHFHVPTKYSPQHNSSPSHRKEGRQASDSSCAASTDSSTEDHSRTSNDGKAFEDKSSQSN